jgi:hypothetical protein
MHTDHLIDLHATPSAHNLTPLCRSSFMDSNMTDDISLHDRHQWSSGVMLSKRCEYCKGKLLSSTDHNGDHRIANGFVCLWCLRSYHRRCWENLSDDANKSKCDYGVFG